jgi:hypothetical protein
LSITVRQPLLRLARCFIMQAVILDTLGISEPQRRNASPVHICWASALKAKLDVDDTAEMETAKAKTKPAWRSVLVKDAVIFGSRWPALGGPFLMQPPCADPAALNVMFITQVEPSEIPPQTRAPLAGR